MAPTLKGIKNAFGKFAHKFRRTKKPDNSKTLIKYSNANEQVKNKRRIDQYVGLTGKLHGCERDLSISVDDNAKKHDEINKLKHAITNYEAIVAHNNKINQELQDELAQCQGSKSRKLGSSARLQNSSSSGRQHTGLTSTGPSSVKSGSRRSSKSIRSRKSELKKKRNEINNNAKAAEKAAANQAAANAKKAANNERRIMRLAHMGMRRGG
jgi:hypothetical protein